MASLADNAPTVERDRIVGRFGDIARDMARGGLAGLAVGVVVGGLGGRVVMRLAALLVPDSAGRFTENGNQIGTITLAGSVGLIVFAGLVVGLAVGIVWVTVSPWIPGSGLRRRGRARNPPGWPAQHGGRARRRRPGRHAGR